MTLTARVTLAAVAAVLACTAGVAAMVYTLEERALRAQIDDDLTSYAAAVSAQLLTSGDVDGVIRSGPLDASPHYAQMVLADEQVVPLSSSRPLLEVDRRTRELAGGSGDRFFTDVEVDGAQVRVLSVPTPEGALQVASEVGKAELQLLQLTGVIALSGAVGAGLALVVSVLVARLSLRPVRTLARTSEDIATTRDFSARMAVGGSDELSRLGGSMNALLDALDESLRTQRQLVADASHELKTPLTGIRTELELARRTGVPPDPEQLEAGVDDLVSAVDDLVELARDRPVTETADHVALDDLVRECLEWTIHHHPTARFLTDLEPHEVRCVRSQVARALNNLLDNALKHAPDTRPVEVTLRDGVLTVRDHGGGIPQADLPFVFERFYRAAGARGRPGAGLGLAIVHKVVREHGWSIRAQNPPDGGLAISLDTRGTAPSPDEDDVRRPARADRGTGSARRTRLALAAAGAALVVAALLAGPALGRGEDVEALRGTLRACGDRLCVATRPVDLEPDATLAGLVGTEVLVEVGSRDQDVRTVNGLPYAAGDAPTAAASATATAPAGDELDALTGRLEACGTGYCVDGVVLDFGPQWWLQRTTSSVDLDHDGSRDTVAAEIRGLVGTRVALRVERSAGGREAGVHTVDGRAYRGSAVGPPPWVSGPQVSGWTPRCRAVACPPGRP